ncbi:tetratricopeptide repeat protein [Allochromatium tepidum]|uniref:Sel1 repeat family protein n=1 Tax=Allochromatium tepidum TaxID=553982 RepID=A0ABM7QQY0_9GAMM|nr:tetratricopeptide repeat protein [Allochromatium tepidum]BCU08449.1 hypothetical protein Atep_31260 [Allochromatium tepidum]
MKSSFYRALTAASVAVLVSASVCAETPPFGTRQPQDTEAMVHEARELLAQQRTREAYLLLEQAKARGNAEAYRLLASLYEGGEGGGVAPVPFIARDFYWMGALSGDPESMYRVAQRYFDRGNEEDGMKWLVRAAERGHPGANLMLAQREFQHNDLANAQRHLKAALEAGYPEAKHFLVSLYETGSGGFPQDFKQAFAVLDELAKSGDAKAMHSMGFYFARGLHGVKNDEAAAHWYHEAAKTGYRDSMEAYSWMTRNGIGTERNVAEADWYYRQTRRGGG